MAVLGNRRAESVDVAQHTGFLFVLAQKHSPYPDLESDLRQEGAIGLIQATKKYDPSRGVGFLTYAGNRARWRMLTAVKKYYRQRPRARVCSMDAEQDEEGGTLHDVIEEPAPGPGERLREKEKKRMVRRAVTALPGRERRVVRAYFWRDKTLQQIGADLGISPERVRQILKKALERLRGRLNK